jgi:hypothetical protein
MEYHGFIFSTHARERMQQRAISYDDVVATLSQPERSHPQGKANTVKFYRTINQRPLQVVATLLPGQHKWLVVSVWVRGEEDRASLLESLALLPFKLLWALIKLIGWGLRKAWLALKNK